MHESVEGMQNAFVVYKMKATVERPRLSGQNLKCKKHIRIVRALSMTDLELTHSMVCTKEMEVFTYSRWRIYGPAKLGTV